MIGTGFKGNIKPHVSSSGQVTQSSEEEHKVTLDYLMSKPRGFLKPYWPIINETVSWIFSELPQRQGMATDFSEARKAGKNSKEYDNAVSSIRALSIEHLNSSLEASGTEIGKPALFQLITNEILGMSILDPIWDDKRVHEVYVNGPYDIQVEMDDGLHRVNGASFENQRHALSFCTKLLGDYNKSLDVSTNPIAESRLDDG